MSLSKIALQNAVLETNPAIFLFILIKLTGVVVGILLESGNVDEDRMAVIRSISTGMFLTFHRAFDISANPKQALENIIKLGIFLKISRHLNFFHFTLFRI